MIMSNILKQFNIKGTVANIVDEEARSELEMQSESTSSLQSEVDSQLTMLSEMQSEIDSEALAISELDSEIDSQSLAYSESFDDVNTSIDEMTAKTNFTIKSDTTHTDVLEISTTDPLAIENKPHLVHQTGSGTPLTNIPSDVSGGFLGYREVLYFDSSNIAVKLTKLSEPFDTYMNRWNGTTWKGWYKSISTVVS
jgi:hypothetical protein